LTGARGLLPTLPRATFRKQGNHPIRALAKIDTRKKKKENNSEKKRAGATIDLKKQKRRKKNRNKHHREGLLFGETETEPGGNAGGDPGRLDLAVQ